MLVAPLRRAIQHLHLSRKTKDNRLERSRGGVRPVAADWSDTGYWTRLTPNPGNSLAFIVWNCCVGGELVQHSAHTAPLARGGCAPLTASLLAVTRARNRVLHASRGAERWERNSVLSDKQLPPSGLIAAN